MISIRQRYWASLRSWHIASWKRIKRWRRFLKSTNWSISMSNHSAFSSQSFANVASKSTCEAPMLATYLVSVRCEMPTASVKVWATNFNTKRLSECESTVELQACASQRSKSKSWSTFHIAWWTRAFQKVALQLTSNSKSSDYTWNCSSCYHSTVW